MAAKEQIREHIREQIKEPKRYQVLIYNDDFTPMDFVVEVLMELFDKEEGKLCGCGDISERYCQNQGG